MSLVFASGFRVSWFWAGGRVIPSADLDAALRFFFRFLQMSWVPCCNIFFPSFAPELGATQLDFLFLFASTGCCAAGIPFALTHQLGSSLACAHDLGTKVQPRIQTKNVNPAF